MLAADPARADPCHGVTGTRDPAQDDRLSDGSADAAMSQDASSVDSCDLDLGELDKVERVKVDRTKLEDLLYGAPGSIETFFFKIEAETRTRIVWPKDSNVLTKRDPQVRIIGLPPDVNMARSIINRELGVRNLNRASLKVDVSYTDHSHMIGMGGKCSKDLSNRTNCHIHFPDCNKQSECEKSNCVSLSGEIPNIEYARIGIRLLQPLVFSVTLPHCHPLHRNGTLRETKDIPDPWKSHIEWAENRYGVKVNPKAKSSNQYTALFVKGSEENSENIQAATDMLINELIHRHYPHEPGHVTNTMEISIHHHKVVQGNVKLIMQRTGAVILFPDAEDRNIPQVKKSSVVITGKVRAVYSARQMLIGSLPIKMTFEVATTSAAWWPRAETLRQMERRYDVTISVPQKSRDNTVLVTIMAMERNVGGIYNARRELLGLNTPTVVPGIPHSYYFDGAPRLQGPHGLLALISHTVRRCLPPFSPVWPSSSPAYGAQQSTNPWSPLMSLGATSPLPVPFGTSSYGLNSLGELGQTLELNNNTLAQHSPVIGYPGLARGPYLQTTGWGTPWTDRLTATDAPSTPLDGMGGASSALAQFIHSATLQQAVEAGSLSGYNPLAAVMEGTTVDTAAATTEPSTHVYSNTGTKETSVGDQLNSSGGSQGFNSSRSSSHSATRSNSPPSDEGMDRRAPGCEKKFLSSLNDYDEKRALAARMRRAPVIPKPRTPTDVFSGYGFSRSSPHWLLKTELGAARRPPTATTTTTSSGVGPFTSSPAAKPAATTATTTTAAAATVAVIASSPTSPPAKTPMTSSPVWSANPSRLPGLMSQSNVFDSGLMPRPTRQVTSIAELIESIDGLKQYSDLFRDEEIDLQVLLAMNEDDLRRLGIKTVGARKKLLMLIQSLNANDLKLAPAIKGF